MGKYRTFWPRLVALIIDGLILGIVDLGLKRIPQPDSPGLSLVISFVTTNIPYLYALLMVGTYGQTLGKMAMGITVVDNTTEGRIGYYQAFLREAIPMVLVNISLILGAIILEDESFLRLSTLQYIILGLPSAMLLIWGILEIVTMLFDEKNRALHDKVAGTVVVKG